MDELVLPRLEVVELPVPEVPLALAPDVAELDFVVSSCAAA